MSFTWKCTPAAPVPSFDDQQEAEDWLTDNYPDLLDAGVAEVSLYEDETRIYVMSLAEA